MDLDNFTLEEIHTRLRTGELSAVELQQACAANYEHREAHLQAYKTWNGDGALKTAQLVDELIARDLDAGPLMGIPISIKDLFGATGLPTFAGSARELGSQWEQPGTLVKGLEDQLSVISGKSHTVEFAFGGIGMNCHWGTPRNPWSKEHRAPGGSSSGAGVSLMQGSALLALGTDTAGSVRIPASFTGTVALKTTYGRWPRDGAVPLSTSLDTPGLLARNISDLIFGFKGVEYGLDGMLPEIPFLPSGHGVRLGRIDDFFLEDVDTDVAKCFEETLSKLTECGFQTSEAKLAGCDEAYDILRQGGLAGPELNAFLTFSLPGRTDELDPVVRLRIEGSQSLSNLDYLQRVHTLKLAAAQALQSFEQHDVLVTPTIACAAPAIADLTDIDDYSKVNMHVLRNCAIVNLLGLCAVSIPMGLDSNGVPMGLQLIAPPFEEEKLLAVARQVEACLGAPAQLLGKPKFLS